MVEPLAVAAVGLVNVIVFVPRALMYELAGTLVPVIGCPKARLETLETTVRTALPLVVMAVGVALAVFVRAVITAPAPGGMPMPVTMLPTAGTLAPRNA